MSTVLRSESGTVSFVDDFSRERLRSLLLHANDNFELYRTQFSKCGILRNDLLETDPYPTFSRLKTIGKEEYAQLQTQSFIAQSHGHFVVDPSSGSTGAPTLKFTSSDDDSAEAEAVRIALRSLGVGPQTRCACLDIGSSQIYLFYMSILREFGVENPMFIKLTSDTLRPVKLLREYDPNLLISIPSVLKRVFPTLQAHYTGASELRQIVFIGEPMEHTLRKQLETNLHAECYSFYGTTEIGSIGIECSGHDGIHVPLNLFIPTLSPWPDSSERCEVGTARYRGQIAWTSIGIRGQPAVKYSVNDLVEIDLNVCSCGETSPRMIFVHRTDEAFFLYGLTLTYDFFLDVIEESLDYPVSLEIQVGHVVESGTIFDQIVLVMDRSFQDMEQLLRNALVNTHPVSELVSSKFLKLEFEFLPPQQLLRRKARKLVRRYAIS